MNRFLFIILSCIAVQSLVNAMERFPLHNAAEKGKLELIQSLIAAQPEGNKIAFVDQQTSAGVAALHHAVRLGHLDVVRVLIGAGANVNLQNNLGHTPLHIAVSLGYADLVHELIEAGADVNMCDTDDVVPLDAAVEFVCISVAFCQTVTDADLNMVQELIAAGADPYVKDKFGETPFQHAIASGSQGLADLFVGYERRMKQARQFAKEKAKNAVSTVVLGTHERIGAESPISLVNHYLLQELSQYIAQSILDTELKGARQPRVQDQQK